MQPRFLITDFFTWFNKGDAAILIGLLKLLNSVFPRSEITVLSLTPDIDNLHFLKYCLCVKSRFFNNYSYRSKSRIKKIKIIPIYLIKAILILLSIKFKKIKLGKDQFILEEYKHNDVIISVGGGFLGGKKYGSILYTLFLLYYSKIIGKIVIIYAQSIEPFKSGIVAWFTMFVLNKIDLIFVREQYSYNLLKQYQIKSKIFLTADTAFLLNELPKDHNMNLIENKVFSEKPLIGITVRYWRFLESKNHKLLFKNYLITMAKLINYWIAKRNATIILFPQVIGEKYDDDRQTSLTLYNLLSKKCKENTMILTEDFTPEELKSLSGKMDLFIGTRMHSNIFALSMRVPVVAIAYEMKTYGIMRMINLEKYVIDIKNISAEKLISLSELVYEKREEIGKILDTEIPRLENISFQSMLIVKRYLTKKLYYR